MKQIEQDRLYSMSETAKFVQKTVLTLKTWDRSGKLRPTVRLGTQKERYYRGSDIVAFIKKTYPDLIGAVVPNVLNEERRGADNPAS